MASKSFDHFRLQRALQNFDYVNGTIKVLIVDSSYVFDPADQFVNDITGELVNDTGAGYERKTVAGKSISIPNGTNAVRYFADNPTWQQINTTTDGEALVFYLEVTDDTDSILMCYNDGVALATNGNDVEAKLTDGAVLDDVDNG